MGTVLADFAGLKAGLSIFNVPLIPMLLLFTVLIFISVYKGNYKTNQAIFLGSAFLYIAYIFSAIMAKPDWALALKSVVVPTNIEFSSGFVFTAIAVLGTTITPWGQFFISSFILDKKLTTGSLKYEQLEVFFGAFLTDFFSFFMIVACAATLFANKIAITGAAEAALAIKPFAGEFAAALLGLGLINAGFIGVVVVALTTAYAFSEFFGYEGSLDGPQNKSKSFYMVFLVQIIIALIFVMLPSVSLFKIALYTQSLNGILLPLIIYFLLKFLNDKELMGQYTNNRFYNYFAIASSVVIVIASGFVMVGTFMGWV
jgi:Mn2+/Fe2+ NRAMP family transporter